ncbi:VOC family protein [Cellulomonas chengniuliangii]|uniref:Putative pterin-4-alpha-carbinolamine dehydratase n=1 Tax=Cellulomonas chengniuliangii TaxID=2968084 RepID=A0ABY5L0K5_9CELL|nr:VOC family protein [Cellulomonas chengniuliangii]MCC2309863.1 4a-hydroxytetrahydrobiopterin dehydratase [Cellulomonas chengniuliangii]MCC2318122.1 4a-hydroxytetrahydrobiopterin dehydratase [Cellulomonas chengniuliangii]UUI76306.1 4a-hydroxytetrahydrobiopterin dehydratase [Cellulomonas chengniuliangii]
MSDLLTHADVTARTDARHWRVLLNTIHASFRTETFTRGFLLAQRITIAAEAVQHHPDLHLTYDRLRVRLTSHDVHGVTDRDIALAAVISQIADELGIESEVPVLGVTEIAVDALDIPAVLPFWRAVFAYRDDATTQDALEDPAGIGPSIWFQQMDAPRPQRNRIHLDVTVPHDVAEQRVAEAIAAGGHLVSGDRAPSFWVLADPEGNEVCVCTWQARD